MEVQDGNWDPALTGKIATQLFAKYGCSGVQGAYGMADYMALAIIASAKQAGCEVGGKDGLIVTGSNCFKAGIESIKAGALYGTATEDPGTIAEQTADYVERFFSGEEPPEEGVREGGPGDRRQRLRVRGPVQQGMTAATPSPRTGDRWSAWTAW